jgi:hypothetical protein
MPDPRDTTNVARTDGFVWHGGARIPVAVWERMTTREPDGKGPQPPASILDLLGDVPVAFGLRAQGHLPTVERMVAEGASWDEIGCEIGWAGEAVEEFYGYEKSAIYALRRASDEATNGLTSNARFIEQEVLVALGELERAFLPDQEGSRV